MIDDLKIIYIVLWHSKCYVLFYYWFSWFLYFDGL